MHITTQRLAIRPFTLADAPFIVELVNDPDWLRFIGDKNIHTLADAENYLTQGPMAMLQAKGFALCAVDEIANGHTVGMCGLIKRDTLADVDIGFAFLPAGRGQGYATEAAQATLHHGFAVLRLPRIVAIANPANQASQRVLEKAGMVFESEIHLAADQAALMLYAARSRAGGV
jgi:[ribosomal protein S5]-alanine N-acetyltransferase